MNLFIMDKEDILKHYKPQTEAENYLVETLRDCYNDLYAIQEVLSYHSLPYEQASWLDEALRPLMAELDTLRDENKRLEDLTDFQKEEIEELEEVNKRWSNIFEELKGIKNEQ